jgi:rhomboid protease GluP
MGAKSTPLILKGDWWRLIVPMFMHAGIVHLCVNMFSFWRMAADIEKDFGFRKIGVIYILAGLGGNIASALFRQTSITVGASGAIFG